MKGGSNGAQQGAARSIVTPKLAHGLALKQEKPAPGVVMPVSVEQLKAVLHPDSHYPTPIRPIGANSSSTRCAAADGGTLIDMTALKKISDIENGTVTAEAGVTLQELSDNLAAQGMEIPGCVDLVSRTVGGAIAGGSLGAAHDGGPASPFSHVVSLRFVKPDGEFVQVTEEQPHWLNAIRLSQGVLGVIYDVTFRVRPIESFVLKHSKMDVTKFARIATALSEEKVGLKFFYLPFKSVVYAELRRAPADETPVRSLPWKVKDVGETAVIPALCEKLSRLVPIAGVRYGLADGLHRIGHVVLNNSLTDCGSSVTEHQAANSRFEAPALVYSTWCFPSENIGELLTEYREFAADYYARTKFRCDMPVAGYRLPMNRSALLAPNFDGPMFALRFVSSPNMMWEDFVMDLAEFAQDRGGVPLFSQTRAAELPYVEQAFGSRLEFFRKMRRRMDPDGRLLNPFLAQYLA